MTIDDDEYMELRGQAMAWIYVSTQLRRWLAGSKTQGPISVNEQWELLAEGERTRRVASSQLPIFTGGDAETVVDLRRR